MGVDELKRRILELVERDEEFRLFIASKIGLLEILKRLEKHDEKFNELLKKFEEHDRRFNEILERIAEHDRKFNEILAEIKALKEKVAEHDRRFNEILERIAEHDRKFNEILAEIASIKRDILELRRFQERLAVSLEEEATYVVGYFLRKNYGIDVKLETIYIDSKVEVDIYGVIDNLCIFGEAAVRIGPSKIKDLLDKYEYVKENYPEKLREKTVLVLYGMRVFPGVEKEAEKHGIWLVTTTSELTKLKI